MWVALLGVVLAIVELPASAFDVSRAQGYVFGLQDDQGATMDCLKVQQDSDGTYLGLYHSMHQGAFELYLAESHDLTTWTRVAALDRHAHQGTLVPVGDEWLLAWEKDGPNGNWIRFAAFESTENLLANRPEVTFDTTRTLSPAAEGTPSIVSVEKGEGWRDSRISVQFHYWRDVDVDRQASGVLQDFDCWRTRRAPERDIEFEPNGGNIGDRDHLALGDNRYHLLEVQGAKNDWTSWRVYLRKNGGPFSLVPLVTPAGATSYANPTATAVTLPSGDPGVVFTLFLPSEGNDPSESGSLIWWITPNESR